jgi:DNA-3-methyladenine glycosylase II
MGLLDIYRRRILKAVNHSTKMPTTRSATRASSTTSTTADSIAVPEPSASKRKTPATKAPRKKARLDVEAEIKAKPYAPVIPAAPDLLPATLSFSYQDAKEHLIEADERFQDVFERNSCKVFEVLDQVEPFR